MTARSVAADPLERIVANPHWLRRFSVREYHKMVEVGILTPDDRVELLEGWIVKKMPQSAPYMSSVSRLARQITRILPTEFTLGIHAPVTLTLSNSEPEPDISVAHGPEEKFDHRHQRAIDIRVLIEVGDTALMDDRLYKGVLYARNKIPEFWLINLIKRQVEVYTKPRAGKYQKTVAYQKVMVYGESTSVPLVLDNTKVADLPVRELMGKA